MNENTFRVAARVSLVRLPTEADSRVGGSTPWPPSAVNEAFGRDRNRFAACAPARRNRVELQLNRRFVRARFQPCRTAVPPEKLPLASSRASRTSSTSLLASSQAPAPCVGAARNEAVTGSGVVTSICGRLKCRSHLRWPPPAVSTESSRRDSAAAPLAALRGPRLSLVSLPHVVVSRRQLLAHPEIKSRRRLASPLPIASVRGSRSPSITLLASRRENFPTASRARRFEGRAFEAEFPLKFDPQLNITWTPG